MRPPAFQEIMTGDLHGKIAGESIRRFHDHRANSVPLDPLHHGPEAWALAYRIRARHRRVVEAIDHLVSVPPGEGGDGRTLSFLAVLECTNFTNEVCEAALAHVIENKAEAAYWRGDLFDKRRKLMDAWAAFCAVPKAGKVVAFGR
jgi:hypothetical protein